MRPFEALRLHDAIPHAVDGGQSLYLHRIVTWMTRRCCVEAVNRGEWIARLFDRDKERLRATAQRLGVQVVLIEYEGTRRQHVDLCGAPCRKAIASCDQPDYSDAIDRDRASGKCVCGACGRPYRDHDDYWKLLSHDGNPFLTLLCDGTLVKL